MNTQSRRLRHAVLTTVASGLIAALRAEDGPIESSCAAQPRTGPLFHPKEYHIKISPNHPGRAGSMLGYCH